uniref:Ig-like domain-containing protein n=1 Tax=Oryzias melastigma TaxID=30732 RepID=A0A3B3CIR1_ORYME
MRTLVVITALLLCSRSCICEFQTVEVQSGEDVTLLCSNLTKDPSQTDWFRVVNSSKVSCISSMFGSGGDPSLCRGFEGGKFAMSSNRSFVSLKIIGVNESDSGLYFCGFYVKKHTIIGDVTQLIIEEEHASMDLLTVILAVLTVLLSAVVVVLAVKFRKLLTGNFTFILSNLDSDDLNYAALSFRQKPKRGGRSPSERELQPHVLYAATR